MAQSQVLTDVPPRSDSFPHRHLGPDEAEQRAMLEALGVKSLTELVEKTVPAAIRRTADLKLPVGSSRVDLQACKLEYSIVSPK